MKRRFAVGTLLALVLVLGITVAAMAAGPGSNSGNTAGAGMAGQGAALHGTFVDADGDGVCDDYANRTPAQDGTGNRWNRGQGQQAGGANFIDEDGDGVCDNCLGDGTQPRDGTGQQMGRGGRWNR